MIARIESPKKARQPVEIRVVVEIQMPAWLQQQQQTAITREVSAEMQNSRIGVPEFFFTPPNSPEMQPVVTVSESLNASIVSSTPCVSPSLVELYRQHLEPRELLQNERKTVRADIARIHRFQFWLEQRSNTPRVGLIQQISEQKTILFDYSSHLRTQEKGCSSASAMLSMNAIMKLCRWCVEAGMLTKAPKCPTKGDLNMMALAITDDSDFQGEPVTVAEFQQMIRADVLSQCQWPRFGNVSPAEFWETVLLSHMVFGFRSQDWFPARTNEKTGLLWSDIIDSTQCPRLDDLHSPHGWLWYLVHKTKKKSQRAAKPVKLLVPLPARLRQLLELFRGLDPERVFPLTSNSRYWSREFTGILERASLDDASRKATRKPVIKLSLGQKSVASFRKGCAAMWADHVDESSASYLLKHSVTDGAVSTITREHYLQAYRPLRAIVQHLETLPIWAK